MKQHMAYITREITASVISLLDDGQKIRAIKLVRGTGSGNASMSLRQSKFAIDHFDHLLPSSLDMESALMLDLDDMTNLLVDIINQQGKRERIRAYQAAADLGEQGRYTTAEMLISNLERIPLAICPNTEGSYEIPNDIPDY